MKRTLDASVAVSHGLGRRRDGGGPGMGRAVAGDRPARAGVARRRRLLGTAAAARGELEGRIRRPARASQREGAANAQEAGEAGWLDGSRSAERKPAADADDDGTIVDDAVGRDPVLSARVGLALGRVALAGRLVAEAYRAIAALSCLLPGDCTAHGEASRARVPRRQFPHQVDQALDLDAVAHRVAVLAGVDDDPPHGLDVATAFVEAAAR